MAQRRSTPLVVPTADPHVCTPGVRLRMLARVPLFADLDVHDIAQVDRRCQAHAFEAGAVVYHAGASATRMYVVATGPSRRYAQPSMAARRSSTCALRATSSVLFPRWARTSTQTPPGRSPPRACWA